jgi:hypothetical protein
MKHWTGENLDNPFGIRGNITRCLEGHTYYSINKSDKDCPVCGGACGRTPSEFLIPRHGFTSAAWDPPRKGYDLEKIGFVKKFTQTFSDKDQNEILIKNLAGIENLSARYKEDGEIFAYNAGKHEQGFAICTKCGYADSEWPQKKQKKDKSDEFLSKFRMHKPLTEPDKKSKLKRCWESSDGSPAIRNISLAAKEVTDVLLIDFSDCSSLLAQNKSAITSIGLALHRAATDILEMDSREIGMLITDINTDKFGVVLYDNVPGGAGHVRELAEISRIWFEKALSSLYVSDDHHSKCRSACLDCILTYDAQFVENDVIDRILAYEVLNRLLKGEEVDDFLKSYCNSQKTEQVIQAGAQSQNCAKQSASQMTNEERLSRAKSRIKKR